MRVGTRGGDYRGGTHLSIGLVLDERVHPSIADSQPLKVLGVGRVALDDHLTQSRDVVSSCVCVCVCVLWACVYVLCKHIHTCSLDVSISQYT